MLGANLYNEIGLIRSSGMRISRHDVAIVAWEPVASRSEIFAEGSIDGKHVMNARVISMIINRTDIIVGWFTRLEADFRNDTVDRNDGIWLFGHNSAFPQLRKLVSVD